MTTKETPGTTGSLKSPIVVDLGKKKRKQVKQLRKGAGKLMDEVAQVVHELKGAGKVTGDAQPIVIVVCEKTKSLKSFMRLPRPWG